MGGQLNRRMAEKAAAGEAELEGKAKVSVELSAYEEACKTDADVRNFDDVLQDRTGRVIHALANGVEIRSLSLESMREVTTCLLEMDQEVAKVILEYKNDIWNTPDLFELVEEYFENSLQTLDFCTFLENCLRKAKDNQLIIQIALKHFPSDGGFPGEKECRKVLEELADFKAAGSPFSDEFLSQFDAIYRRHKQMLEKLHARRSKLDKKLKHVKAWRKISNIIFVAAFATMLICSVVAAAMAAPPVAAALGVAVAIPIGSLGKWVNSLWSKYEDTIKGQRDVIGAMHVGTFLAIKDLETIRVLVDRMESTISSMVKSVELCLKDREAVLIGIEHIKRKQECFENDIEDLFQHVDRCSREIRQARTLVVQKIIKA